MDELTLSAAAKRLEKYVFALPFAKQLNVLSGARREAMIDLRDHVSEARVCIVRYQSSDDSTEQSQALRASIEEIIATNEAIVYASQFELLDPADVAHLSALAEQLKERLQ